MANILQLRDAARTHALLRDRIADAFGLAADDPALANTVDGESDLKELCAYALREAVILDSRIKALGDVIDGMKGRQERLKIAKDKIREAVAMALFDAGEKKLTLPDMTVSVTQRQKLITDDEKIPSDFKTQVITYKVDREKLKEALDNGALIPGVTYGNAAPSITIRTK